MTQQLTKVLLVGGEDQGNRLGWLADLTRDLGCDVEEVADGASALLAIHRQRPDLVIAKSDLEILSGYQLLVVLRGQSDYRRLPVILLTPKGTDAELSRGWTAGADLCVPMDQSREDILRTIARVLATTYRFNIPPAWLEEALASGEGPAR